MIINSSAHEKTREISINTLNDEFITYLLSRQDGKYTDLITDNIQLTNIFNKSFPEYGTYSSRIKSLIKKPNDNNPILELRLGIDIVNGLNLITENENILTKKLEKIMLKKIDEADHNKKSLIEEYKSEIQILNTFKFLRGDIIFDDLNLKPYQIHSQEYINSIKRNRNLSTGTITFGFTYLYSQIPQMGYLTFALLLYNSMNLCYDILSPNVPYQIVALKEKFKRADMYLNSTYRPLNDTKVIEIYD